MNACISRGAPASRTIGKTPTPSQTPQQEEEALQTPSQSCLRTPLTSEGRPNEKPEIKVVVSSDLGRL
jgi:hypothetical protein